MILKNGMRKTFFDIPVHRESDTYSYICWNDIPEEHREDFGNFMDGQTVSAGSECGAGHAGIYVWDFERWYKKKFHNTPTYFD